MSRAVGKAQLGEVVRGVWPFVAMMLFAAVILYFVPGIAFYIPFNL